MGKDFSITENTVLNEEDLIEKLSSINKEKNKIPLFLRDENNQLNFLDDLTFEQQFFKKNQLLVVMEEEK